MQMRVVGVITLCAALAGCAGSPVAVTRDARLNYEKSVADYRACLVANQANVRACDGKRLIMETDERAFNNHSADLGRMMGGSGTTCTTIGNTTNCY
jgi:hypothetical protein